MGLCVLSALTPGETQESVPRHLDKLQSNPAPALVLVFASPVHSLAAVMESTARRFPDAICLGATTAGELTEQGDAKGALSGLAVSGDLRVFAGIGTGLSTSPETAVRQALSGVPETVEGFPHRTAVMLLDPLTGRGEEATLLAATELGPNVPLVGGAAGDDLAMASTQVALGAQAASDAVVMAVLFSKQRLGIGVGHGHTPLSAPLRVTKADGNVVFEIDDRPAWEVWVEQTRAAALADGIDPEALPADAVGGYLLRYEAGLATGREHTIRAPLSRGDDGSLSFACGIHQGAELVITRSTAEAQLRSARLAARRARESLDGAPVAGAVVFDCICRNLILQDDFSAAVRGMSEELGSVPLAGFETYGEIALGQGDLSGFHNTTTVVLAFPAEP
ncbi:MAG: FIST C-terminal domain-containing protein [Myxococcales bacterium]|nr:FIST C-terminal domain-containing protein [Myxococcales bacterium]MCB9583084.1 FIST C-terminal domain-containing protein [Polyangiaceae bacterium]